MRRQAKASSAGSTWVGGVDRGLIGLACLGIFGLAAFLGIGTSSAGADPGEIPGRGFLPDNRGWEKVSPDDKNGSSAIGRALRSVNAAGDRIMIATRTPSPGAHSGGAGDALLASRTSSGWHATPIDPPAPSGVFLFSQLEGFAPEQSASFFMAFAALAPGATESAGQIYRRDGDGHFTLITPLAPSPLPFGAELPQLGGYSTDLSHVVFESPVDQLTENGPLGGANHIYESVNGEVRLVDVLPDGTPAPGALLGSGPDRNLQNSVSADGSRVAFHTTTLGGTNERNGQIYVRDDHGTPTTADDSTAHATASQRTDCADHDPCAGTPEPDPAGPFPAAYWGAEAGHGSRVLFTSCEQLTDDSTAGEDENQTCHFTSEIETGANGRDLYLYDVDTDQLSDLTTNDPGGADVFGVVGSSEDLQRIYFVAGGNLDPVSTDEQPGKFNLYLWDHGTTHFIATLDDFPFSGGDPGNDYEAFNPATGRRLPVTRVSADGNEILFASRAPLTGFDNVNLAVCKRRSPGPDTEQGTDDDLITGRCREVFLFDARADGGNGALTCISCHPGTPARGNAVLYGDGATMIGFSPDPLPQNIADDGHRAYFETPDPLVPSDLNSVQDVYQWQDGEVSLISSGTAEVPAHFLEATPSGDDVFFTTAQRLLGADRDDSGDVYDARVGGGFPEPIPPATPCEGDGCRGPLSSPPADTTPATSTFSGPEDPHLRPRCAAAKVRRKGRCVAKQHKRNKNRANNHRRASR